MTKSSLPEHGVLLQINNMGIYLIGDSGVGKSEIALRLIYQGACLICDDSPDLAIDSNKNISGTCPEGFYGLMHIHDIGIINLSELIGPQACQTTQQIDLVIELIASDSLQETLTQQNPQKLLTPNYQLWHYQSCSVTGIGIHLYPDRNIPTIITTAIQHFSYYKKLISTK